MVCGRHRGRAVGLGVDGAPGARLRHDQRRARAVRAVRRNDCAAGLPHLHHLAPRDHRAKFDHRGRYRRRRHDHGRCQLHRSRATCRRDHGLCRASLYRPGAAQDGMDLQLSLRKRAHRLHFWHRHRRGHRAVGQAHRFAGVGRHRVAEAAELASGAARTERTDGGARGEPAGAADRAQAVCPQSGRRAGGRGAGHRRCARAAAGRDGRRAHRRRAQRPAQLCPAKFQPAG